MKYPMRRTHSTSSTAVTMTSSVSITLRASGRTSWSEERRTTTSDRPNGRDVSSLDPASYPTLWDVWMDSSPRRSILTRSGASSTGMKRTNVSSYSSLMRWISARCLLQNSIIRDGRSSFFLWQVYHYEKEHRSLFHNWLIQSVLFSY